MTIIIPTYNRADTLHKVLSKILSQHEILNTIDIIVVDDGSTDNTKDVITPYMSKATYLYQTNKGPAAARNVGMRVSKGDYVQFLDADDVILPQKFELQVKLLEEHPQVDVLASGYVLIDDSGRILEEIEYDRENITFDDLILGNPFAPESLLFRRKCFHSTGFFDEGLKGCEDWDMWLRIAAQGHHFRCCNQKLSQHSILEGGVHSVACQMCECRLEMLDKIFATSGLGSSARDLRDEAYFNAHLKCSWGYYSGGEIREGRKHFIKAIELNPLALTDFRTFYQFDNLFKPLGYGGAAMDLGEFENVKGEIFFVLHELYRT